MSEFSEGYFLKTKDTQEASQLLKNSNLEGYISEEVHNDWVLILPNKEAFESCSEIIENNKGILLHYQYADDHGFFFALYQGNQAVSYYEDSYDEMSYNNNNLNLDVLASTLNFSSEDIIKIKKLFKDVSKAFEDCEELEDEEFEKSYELIQSLRSKFMEILKISPYAYKWVSYHYASLEDDGIEIKLKKIIS